MSEGIGITIIADRYAEAMLDLAQEQQVLDFVKNDIPAVVKTIQDNSDLSNFLNHPLITTLDKKEVMGQIFKDHINTNVLNLIYLLLDRNRMFLLHAIATSFKKLFNRRFNIVEAEVITAIQIDQEHQNRIKEKLAHLLSKHVELKTTINPDIIGGVIVQLEDNVIDGSINGRLEKIKQQLT
jgi:F-type H+-transporting ATPase subunit delta